MTHFLRTIFLVNALLAVTFGLFIELCNWCVAYDVTPWLSIPGTMGIFGFIYWQMLRAASRRFV